MIDYTRPKTQEGTESVEARWASRQVIRRWILLAGGIGLIMLLGVGTVASIVNGDASIGDNSGVLYSGSWHDVQDIVQANILVFAIHFGACWIGAILGRPVTHSRNHLPSWLGRGALLYAGTVTATSICLQIAIIGHLLADFSAWIQISPWVIITWLLPHAYLELMAIFLPLAVYLLHYRTLGSLQRYALQAVSISIPLLVIAAIIEVFVTPLLFQSAL